MTESKKMEKVAVKIPNGKSSKNPGFGIRHVQMICMFSTMVALLMARSSMGVAILAMTDTKHHNSNNAEVYNWDKNIQGLILSSFFWGYMPMQIPAGLLAKKFGGKPILLVALLTNGLITALFPTLVKFGGWPVVCMTRVVMGLTQACLFPASHTLLGRWLPSNERTTYTGIVYSGPQIGTIIAMPLSGYLAGTESGWKMIFYVISAIVFLTSAMWYWFSASTPAQHSLISEDERIYIEMGISGSALRGTGDSPIPWRAMLQTKALWAIVVAQVGGTVFFILFFVDLPTFLERAMNISLKDSAMLSALPYVGMGVGNILSAITCEQIYNRGWLSVGTCRKIFTSITLLGGGLGLICQSFLGPDSKNFAIALLVIILTLYGFSNAGYMVNHLDLSPHFAGVMLSISNCAGGFAMIGTPVLTSFILRNDSSDFSRWRIMFLITAGIIIFSNVIYVIFGSSDLQAWDSPDFKYRMKADPEEMKPLDKKKQKELEANQSSTEFNENINHTR